VVTDAGTFTIFPSAATLNIPTVTFNNLNVGGSSGSTLTMQSDLNVTGSITQATGTNVSWTGAYDWYCGTYNAAQAAATANNLTIYANRTFHISTATNIYGAYALTPTRFLIKSSAGGTKANIAYSGTAAAFNWSNVSTTDIAFSPAVKEFGAGVLTTSTGITNFTGADVGGGTTGGTGVTITNY
jgi:hypothetical protein